MCKSRFSNRLRVPVPLAVHHTACSLSEGGYAVSQEWVSQTTMAARTMLRGRRGREPLAPIPDAQHGDLHLVGVR